MRDDYPKTLKVLEIKKEAKGYYTVFLPNILKGFNPGQFVMLWLPGVDEKPFGISYLEKDNIGITFEVKGRFTKALCKVKKGDVIGIRGPYGNGFPEPDDGCVIVGGGCGIAPLAPIAETSDKVIIGSRSAEFLLFKERFSQAVIVTDDGSMGRKGFVTSALEELIKSDRNISAVFCCGPEIMMQKVMDMCKKYSKRCYISAERYMKCGFGICGQCMCGDKAVCIDGPVFEASQMLGNPDFNNSARLKSGKKVPLAEYYAYRTE